MRTSNWGVCGRRAVGIALRIGLVAGAFAPGARADEAALLGDIAAFLKTEDFAERAAIAERMQRDPAYDRAKVGTWLHAADLWQPLPAGRRELQVPLPKPYPPTNPKASEAGGRGAAGKVGSKEPAGTAPPAEAESGLSGVTRTVVLRIPRDYDPHRAWPLIYAHHGQSGNGDMIIGYLEQVLGDEVEQFVIAAPTDSLELSVHDPTWPPVGEHPAVLKAIRQTVHVNSDRVYVTGYSRGGHATWALAMLYPDRFAGAMPLAGTVVLVTSERLWDSFLANLTHLPILAMWGKDDTLGPDGKPGPEGGIAGVSRKLRESALKLGVPLTAIEDPDKGHGGIVPPEEEWRKLLSVARERTPAKVEQTFRHIVWSSAYWLEAVRWTGDEWGAKPPPARMGEKETALSEEDYLNAAARAYRGTLGTVRGARDGQTVKVEWRHVSAVIAWLGDEMVDWSKPVVFDCGDKKKPELTLTPDLYVCLSQAARTWDFDRLRWAGVRLQHGEKPVVLSAQTDLEELARAKRRGKEG